ncbi:STAS domain-containing protein [Streptomyces sp. NPDC046985]|uniref:STAS domain-containing protein n=1 Tax=Streptomyces sp. NPDC046985 TaxID=3155377 RepID=UPI003411DDCA
MDGDCAVHIAGSVDWHDAQPLRRALLEDLEIADAEVVVDLRRLEFADSSLLQAPGQKPTATSSHWGLACETNEDWPFTSS